MKTARVAFLGLLGIVIFLAGCCGGSSFDPEKEKTSAAGRPAWNSGEAIVSGRILRDKTKKTFSTGWGFRGGEKEQAAYYLLKTYPKEFDDPFNASFMNERRATLKLELGSKGGGTLADPIPAEITDIVDISRRLDGN